MYNKKHNNVEFDETYYLRTLLIRIHHMLTSMKDSLGELIKEIRGELSEQELKD
tara:strand:- start:170 stop:331 length:162 start_codon:yes stop_codon:yes gene_type:complete